VVSIVSLVACFGCGGSQPAPEAAPQPEAEPAVEPPAEPPPAAPASAAAEESTAEAPPASVEVECHAKSKSKLPGKGSLTETAEGVKVVLTIEGISPGDHGAHVHEKGDCSSPDGSSAGGHFNPGTHPHALPANSPRHLGDLGNITIGKDGKGTLEIVAP